MFQQQQVHLHHLLQNSTSCVLFLVWVRKTCSRLQLGNYAPVGQRKCKVQSHALPSSLLSLHYCWTLQGDKLVVTPIHRLFVRKGRLFFDMIESAKLRTKTDQNRLGLWWYSSSAAQRKPLRHMQRHWKALENTRPWGRTLKQFRLRICSVEVELHSVPLLECTWFFLMWSSEKQAKLFMNRHLLSFLHSCPILSPDLQPCVIFFGIQVCILNQIIASTLSFGHWWCHCLILTICRNLDANGLELIRDMIWWTCPNLSWKRVLNQMNNWQTCLMYSIATLTWNQRGSVSKLRKVISRRDMNLGCG